MNGRKILSTVLAFVMIFSLVLTTIASAALIPPKNVPAKLVPHERKNITQDFATQGMWDAWVNDGSPVVEVLQTGGPAGEGALQFSNGGARGMVLLNQFGNLEDFDELTFKLKSTQPFTIRFALRDQTADPQDIGSSRTVSIPSTGGVWSDVTIKRTDFYGGILTDEQIDNLKSIYVQETNNYAPVVFMFMGSQDATISNLYARWYEMLQPVNDHLTKERTMTGTQKPATWGTWGGTVASYIAGMGEDGVSDALHITGGANGGGTQLALDNGAFNNFVGFDAFKLRVKSSASFQVKMQLEYRASNPKVTKGSKGVTIPSTNGVWKDVYVSAAALKPDVDGDWIYNMKHGYTTDFQPIILMRFEQTNFGASNYATIGNIKALWYKKLPSMSAISFTNNGINIDDGLMDGTTNVNVVLNNTSSDDYAGIVLVAAMYKKSTKKLVSIGSSTIDVNKYSQSNKTVSVTMPDSNVIDYELKVLLWENKNSLSEVTEVMKLDAYGASGQY